MVEFGGGDLLARLIQAITFRKTAVAIRLIRSGVPLDAVLTQTVHGHPLWSAPLTSAVLMGNMEVFEAVLEAGANPNTALPDGQTALEAAARLGQEAMVRTLLDQGAAIEPRRDQLLRSGWPMLHSAAGSGNLAVVKLLVDRGLDISARDESGRTALDIAKLFRHDSVAVYFREVIAASQQPLGLHDAAADGLLERVAELLDSGTPVDAPEPVRQRTALHLAVLRAQFAAARLLLERGADVNAHDVLGHVCLTVYRNYDNVRLLKLLLHAGADPNSRGPDGLTPFLWHVKERCGVKVLRMLLDAGADVHARTPQGQGALELAPLDTASVRGLLKDLLGVAPDGIEQLRSHMKQFPVLAAQTGFQAQAARLGEIFGRKPAPWKYLKGGVYFHNVSLLKYPAPFVTAQDEVRAQGLTLLHAELTRDGDRASLVLLPTENQYAALLARGTNGANHGHSTRAVISWLMELEKENPFVLTGCTLDCVFGRFVATVKDPEEWAEKMIAFCPDLNDGNPNPAHRLAREISESRAFYLWWD